MGKQTFFLGCMIPLRYAGVEVAARHVFRKLGIDLTGVERYTCCPEPVVLGLADNEFALTTTARNLALAEKMGEDLVVLCSGCYETLVEADNTLKRNAVARKRVNELLSDSKIKYEGNVKVKHFVEFLHEDVGVERIIREVKTPVDVPVAVHYGCHLYREEEDGADTLRKPKMMRELVAASGAKVVDYGLEQLCCGFPMSQFDKDLSLTDRVATKIKAIGSTKAEALVFCCPACTRQFETGQGEFGRLGVNLTKYPCIHLLELLALSFGLPPGELSFDLHFGSAAKGFADRYWGAASK